MSTDICGVRMRKFKTSFSVLIALSFLFLGSCSPFVPNSAIISTSVPPGSAIIREQAIRMAPPQGWGAIYVFRPGLPPGVRLWGVNLDSTHFGYLAPKSFLYGVVQPGLHSLDLQYPKSRIEFESKKGENSYFKITPGFPGVVLSEIDSVEAKRLLDEYTLSALNIFENDEIRQMLRSSQQ